MKLTSDEVRTILENFRGTTQSDKWIDHCICVGDTAGSVTNDPSHPITINSNTITDLSEIMPTETYMITPAYDSAGYINTLNIDKIM